MEEDYQMKNTDLNEMQQLWLSRIEAFKRSGLTQAEFCRTSELNLKQFNYWFRKFKKTKPASKITNSPKWVSVNIKEPVNRNMLSVKIGKATIEVATEFNKKLLVEVVEALSELC